jgi:threonine/homoserine/homoserine lactone efflux protein
MIPFSELLIFIAAALLLVLTPGPNMMYLISRSICQGFKAGLMSLCGIVPGFAVHMLAASIGLSTIFMSVPFAYDLLKWCGALYLLWMAWEAVRPGKRSPFEPRELPPDSSRKLFLMGFLTSLLNPKVALFYLSLLPQFVDPHRGSVLLQSIILGLTQITVSFSVDLLICIFAARIAKLFSHHPLWLSIQRYVMGSVLVSLAFRLAFEQRSSK